MRGYLLRMGVMVRGLKPGDDLENEWWCVRGAAGAVRWECHAVLRAL